MGKTAGEQEKKMGIADQADQEDIIRNAIKEELRGHPRLPRDIFNALEQRGFHPKEIRRQYQELVSKGGIIVERPDEPVRLGRGL